MLWLRWRYSSAICWALLVSSLATSSKAARASAEGEEVWVVCRVEGSMTNCKFWGISASDSMAPGKLFQADSWLLLKLAGQKDI